MASEISFSGEAYCKIILHAVKYPHCAVNGVLLAETSQLKSKNVVFVDAIPLFHIQLNLTPMAEIALTQIDHWASNLGLSIAGYYVANENLRENSFEKSLNRIADKIAENCNTACLVVVDNNVLSTQLDNLAIRVAQHNEGKFRPVDMQRVSLSPFYALDACTSLLERQAYKSIIDFDNHLDNITLDWTNKQINNDVADVLKYLGSLY